ncbi:hypothetical protein [Agrobacterium tumefaciens]|uniref:hypothetical protein n=1 Tax=Agrobacterium tumefaciens TaxID=358 RepID=UPI00287BEC8E|nr:hypothetical protein [Agrobacterium tumefaciens]MDS7597623.1 hypothetical protein [Agrobacterium tumefaciens]
MFSVWMAIAAFLVIVTMAAGIATSAGATEMVDTLQTASIPQSVTATPGGSNTLLIVLSAAAFSGLGIGGVILTRRSLKDEARRYK